MILRQMKPTSIHTRQAFVSLAADLGHVGRADSSNEPEKSLYRLHSNSEPLNWWQGLVVSLPPFFLLSLPSPPLFPLSPSLTRFLFLNNLINNCYWAVLCYLTLLAEETNSCQIEITFITAGESAAKQDIW